jgi:K+ transporter
MSELRRVSISQQNPRQTATLALGAIGVVYGDIGTSPLYALREALAQSAERGIVQGEVMGVLSIALWALMLVTTEPHRDCRRPQLLRRRAYYEQDNEQIFT